MAVKTNPDQAASLYVTGMTNATERIRIGVEAVTVSPCAKAAAQKTKMLQNLTAAVNSGKWERGLNAVSVEQWKAAFLSKGLNRIAEGATAARPKMVEFFTKLFAFQNNLLTRVQAMPSTTLDQSIARMTTWVREMATFENR